MYLSKPATEDKTGCPFSGLAGYESLKEAGVIDDERL